MLDSGKDWRNGRIAQHIYIPLNLTWPPLRIKSSEIGFVNGSSRLADKGVEVSDGG